MNLLFELTLAKDVIGQIFIVVDGQIMRKPSGHTAIDRKKIGQSKETKLSEDTGCELWVDFIEIVVYT